MGISTYQPPDREIPGVQLTSKLVERVREAIGGQLEPLPITKLHWFLPDLEVAQTQADRGDLQLVGMLGQPAHGVNDVLPWSAVLRPRRVALHPRGLMVRDTILIVTPAACTARLVGTMDIDGCRIGNVGGTERSHQK